MSLEIAVVGAGLSGLVAAELTQEAGHAVRVFEKSRGTGGRMATRRAEEFTFDHGAQYFTVRDERFRSRLEHWQRSGLVEEWRLRLAAWSRNGLRALPRSEPRYVAVPGMSALCRHLSSNLDVVLETRIARLRRNDQLWELIDDAGSSVGSFDAVALSAPPAQSRALLDTVREHELQEIRDLVASVELQPCWAVMLGFDSSIGAQFDGAFVADSPLSWVASGTSKPHRHSLHAPREAWTLHGSSEWSAEHLESPGEVVVARLTEAFSEVLGGLPLSPDVALAHRWRYSIADCALDVGQLWSSSSRIGVCGDWCAGSRVEGAFLSGLGLGQRLAEL